MTQAGWEVPAGASSRDELVDPRPVRTSLEQTGVKNSLSYHRAAVRDTSVGVIRVNTLLMIEEQNQTGFPRDHRGASIAGTMLEYIHHRREQSFRTDLPDLFCLTHAAARPQPPVLICRCAFLPRQTLAKSQSPCRTFVGFVANHRPNRSGTCIAARIAGRSFFED